MAKGAKKVYYRNDEFLCAVGAKIREHRLRNGLTQMELAYACNDVDYSQINRVELGKVNFSISFLALVAEVLKVETKDLLP